jgi:hypothetical protein
MSPRGKLMVPGAGGETPHRHADAFELQFGSGSDRILIAARGAHVDLVSELLDCIEGDLYVLYVLTADRGRAEMGRYESPILCHDEVKSFLTRYREFLERDGRHDTWVSSVDGTEKLIYDRHDVIFAYGPLDRFRQVLEKRGLVQGAVEIPYPHSHWFLPEFDQAQSDLLAHWSWKRFPLQDSDLED